MKLLGIIDKLLYKRGSLPNRTITYGNNIYGTFQKYLRMTKPPVLIPILSNNFFNLMNDGVIYDNEISAYDQAYGSNGELLKIEHGNYHIITVGNHCFRRKHDSKIKRTFPVLLVQRGNVQVN